MQSVIPLAAARKGLTLEWAPECKITIVNDLPDSSSDAQGPCCRGATDPGLTILCPSSGGPGLSVDAVAVKALLTVEALRRFEPGEYRFCPDAQCDTVYFDTASRTFTCADLRVPVWQKEPPGARLYCYCFGENEAAIRAEIARAARSFAVERVTAHIRAGRCACEVRNPRGTCCLGDLVQAVKRLLTQVDRSTSGSHHG